MRTFFIRVQQKKLNRINSLMATPDKTSTDPSFSVPPHMAKIKDAYFNSLDILSLSPTRTPELSINEACGLSHRSRKKKKTSETQVL